ncbi:MAG: beta-ketoacyl-[Bacteroidales bacterium]|nr:beta-ketoacyl-[acyl-carrier-protein] synthase II [Bacteroidales bacterium]
MNLKRVVITGIGALTPIGNTAKDFWGALLEGVSGAGLITRFDAEQFKCKIACELKGFDPSAHFSRKDCNRLDAYSQYGIVAADEAVGDAHLDEDCVRKERVGVIWGSGIGGVQTLQWECVDYALGDGSPRFSPYFVPKMIADICAGHISIRHGFKGPNYATVAACASSSAAIASAFDMIRLGRASVMVAGGSEAAVIESSIGGFSAMQALSTRNDDPLTASRPFDKGRDGFVLGEGAGAVVLEDLEHALARGATVYAEVTGVGLSAD